MKLTARRSQMGGRASEGQTRKREKLEIDVKDFGRGHV
jgi:hypothetical protein